MFPLTLFSVGGMMLFVSANDLLLLFIALEVLSLPLYLMAGLSRRRRLLSQESAVKYFLLGAFASAFFLYGLALLYGYANSVDLADIFRATGEAGRSGAGLGAGGGGLSSASGAASAGCGGVDAAWPQREGNGRSRCRRRRLS